MSWRAALRILLPVLCIGAVAWVVCSLEPGKLAGMVARADPFWLAMSLLPLPIRFWIWGYKWRAMLPRPGDLSRRTAVRAIFAGAFLNLVTPTAKLAGGAYRAYLLQKRIGGSFSRAFGWSIADQVTNLAGCLTLYGFLALASTAGAPRSEVRSVFLISGTIALSMVGLFVTTRHRAWPWIERSGLGRNLTFLLPARYRTSCNGPGDHDWLAESLSPLLRESAGPRRTARDLGLAAMSWSVLCIANSFAFRALGVEASLIEIAAVLVLGAFAGSLSGMGGVGVTEAVMIGLYAHLGIDEPTAVAASLMHRAGLYLTIVAIGAPAMILDRANLRPGPEPPCR